MRGNLGQSYLPEIIHSLHDSQETGILRVSRDKVSKRIYFGKGEMTFANSSFRGDRLGEFLVRNGKITNSHLALASQKVTGSGRRLGETFVSMGLLTETEMEVGVAEQVLSIIYSLFPWDTGEYRFQEHASPIADELALRLPTIPVILEGVRHIQSMDAIRCALGEPKSIVSYAGDSKVLLTDFTLTPEESFVFSRVDGQSSVADIIALSPLGEDRTLRCLYALISGGFLELGGKSRHMTPSSKRIDPFALESPRSEPLAKRELEVGRPALSPEEQWIRDDVMAKRAAVANGTYYDWLELPRSANSEEVKKAYLTMIKRYHPDRLRSQRLAYLRGDLEELLSKMTEAYKTLHSPVARRRFDNSLRTEAVRGEDLSPRVSLPKSGSAATSSLENIAARYYREAKKHFLENHFHETVELMEEAVRFDSKRSKYHKLLARALAKNPYWRKRAEEHYQMALELSPFDFDCLVGLGELYDAAGMTSRASALFTQALAVEPGNAELKDRLSMN